MGCSGSKCDPHADSIPAKIRPLLLRRFDELKRRSRIIVSSKSLATDLSKKELLKDAVISDDDISAHHQQPNSDQLIQKKEANDDGEKAAKEAQPPLRSSRAVVPEPGNEPERMLKQRSKQDMHVKVDMSAIGNRISDDCLYPGSPSFRFYFIDSLTDKDDDDNYSDNEDDFDKKSQIDRSSSVDAESINSDSASKTKKKSRRVHRLRNMIPKGRARSVKKLLSVRSCYNPSSTAPKDDAILLRQKKHHSI
ncbi:uncharacterized protein [Euphorbia lathyris]|uniref:uncharacterized protein n=1 Tax=Euphorbia lathyris TaxID=212925 RepID=UPI003313979A